MSALKQVQSALLARQIDGILVSSEINQRYLTGFPYSDGYLLITQEQAYLLADSRYTEAARLSVSPDWCVIRPEGTMIATIGELTHNHGVPPSC